MLRDVLAPSHASAGQLLQLLLPWGHSPALRPHIASAISARVQLLSLAFAVLVPLWGLLDLAVFGVGLGGRLALLRLASAAVFFLLLWPYRKPLRHPYAAALASLVGLLLVPPLFYLVSLAFVDPAAPGLGEGARFLLQVYALLPTLSLAGLAIFPLSALETLLIALPIAAIAVLGAELSGSGHLLAGHGPTLWFMAMMVGVAAFSGMSQLHYMETLVRAAAYDVLTGVRSRRSGMEELDRLWLQAQAEDRGLGIAFIDLDHFKQINDRWGHDQGDRALIALTQHLARCLRRADVLVRWGGEEFVAVLPDMPVEAQRAFVQRLQRGGFGTRPDDRPITVSIGLADRRSDHVRTWEELIELADQRMYAAKQAGRARVMFSDGQVLPLAALATD